MTPISLNAKNFFDIFVDKYKKNRELYSDIDWKELWEDTSNWSFFMIDNHNSVIRQMAESFGLVCPQREPLRIDAIFTPTEKWDWFPISVAIEHENNYREFQREIKKLLSVKCGLKVGITYSIIENKKDNLENRLEFVKYKIEKSFFSSFNNMDNKLLVPHECYLFIIGCETSPRKIEWYYTVVSPKEGLTNHLTWTHHH
ncbi:MULTISPECIES: hypothetical protein [Acidiphilium]|uniref:hypothetical protein n=1 Tax=Acidiphilium TaxID=522 RepID=UPI001115544A|nr:MULTISPECIES: hypothetical protein [Acidiphilium]